MYSATLNNNGPEMGRFLFPSRPAVLDLLIMMKAVLLKLDQLHVLASSLVAEVRRSPGARPLLLMFSF